MQDDPYYPFWRKHWISAAYLVAALIMLLSIWIWFNRIETHPRRAFWNAISQNLATSSVTVSASQAADGNDMKQSVVLQLGAQNTAHAIVNITQGGAKVTTEVIGTPTADYTRYTSVNNTQAPFHAKNVTNVWAKSEPQLFGQTTLGIGLSLGSVPVPIANVHGADHAQLLKEIKDRNLYKVALANVKKERVNGRLLYTYDVKAAPFVYVEVLQLVAKQLGITSLAKVEPGEYRDLQDIAMRITVDVRSHHITKVAYNGGSYAQTYSAYDVLAPVAIPSKTIPMIELQKRLQASGQH